MDWEVFFISLHLHMYLWVYSLSTKGAEKILLLSWQHLISILPGSGWLHSFRSKQLLKQLEQSLNAMQW